MESNEKVAKARKKKSSSIILKLLIVVLLFVIAAVSVVGFMSYSEYQMMKNAVNIDTIYENIYVNDVNIGKLTKEKALEKLNESVVTDVPEKTILVKSGDKQVTITYKGLYPYYDFAASVEEAYSYARKGSMKERYNQIVALQTIPKKITYEPETKQELADAKSKINAFADELLVPPVNATLTMQGGKFSTTKEKDGQKADADDAIARVEKLMEENAEGEVEMVLMSVPPELTSIDLGKATSLIGSYSTTYSGALDLPRNINIINAASKINNYTVNPGEVFSTNAAFGEMSVQNGYRAAPVIVAGNLEDGIGGGVCQVSSTLYNALLNAELEIVERQNHSLKVGYVDYGYDATLAGDYIDLKFKNNTSFPVFVESYLEDNKVIVNIYGYEIHDPTRKLVFSNALVETIAPAAELVVEDPTLPLGQRVNVAEPKTGYKYQVYKTVFEHDKEIEKVTINKSTYKAKRGEVRLGTGVNVVAPPAGNANLDNPAQTPDLFDAPPDVVEPLQPNGNDPVDFDQGPVMPD